MRDVWVVQGYLEAYSPARLRAAQIPASVREHVNAEVVGATDWEKAAPWDLPASKLEAFTERERYVANRTGEGTAEKMEVAARVASVIAERLAAKKPAAVMLWNNGFCDAHLWTFFCGELGIPVVHVEHGWLPETWIYDPAGSYILGKSILDDMQTEDGDAAAGRSIIQRWRSLCGSKHKQGPGPIPPEIAWASREGPVLLLAGQLMLDASMIYPACSIRSPEALVNQWDDWSGLVVMKRHPHSERYEGHEKLAAVHARLRERSLRNDRFLYVEENVSIHALLRYAVGASVINSNVGLEAAMRGKPVVQFGDSPYGGRGFTFDARKEPERLASGAWAKPSLAAEQATVEFVGMLRRYLSPHGCWAADWAPDSSGWWAGSAWGNGAERLADMWRKVLRL